MSAAHILTTLFHRVRVAVAAASDAIMMWQFGAGCDRLESRGPGRRCKCVLLHKACQCFNAIYFYRHGWWTKLFAHQNRSDVSFWIGVLQETTAGRTASSLRPGGSHAASGGVVCYLCCCMRELLLVRRDLPLWHHAIDVNRAESAIVGYESCLTVADSDCQLLAWVTAWNRLQNIDWKNCLQRNPLLEAQIPGRWPLAEMSLISRDLHCFLPRELPC